MNMLVLHSLCNSFKGVTVFLINININFPLTNASLLWPVCPVNMKYCINNPTLFFCGIYERISFIASVRIGLWFKDNKKIFIANSGNLLYHIVLQNRSPPTAVDRRPTCSAAVFLVSTVILYDRWVLSISI